MVAAARTDVVISCYKCWLDCFHLPVPVVKLMKQSNIRLFLNFISYQMPHAIIFSLCCFLSSVFLSLITLWCMYIWGSESDTVTATMLLRFELSCKFVTSRLLWRSLWCRSFGGVVWPWCRVIKSQVGDVKGPPVHPPWLTHPGPEHYLNRNLTGKLLISVRTLTPHKLSGGWKPFLYTDTWRDCVGIRHKRWSQQYCVELLLHVFLYPRHGMAN